MVDDTKKNDELAAMVAKIETATPLAPAAAPKSMAAVRPAHSRIGSEPKRLSKGQRRHIRRQKQAGELKAIDRRQ